MRTTYLKIVLIGIIAQIVFLQNATAQEERSVLWLSFQELEDSLKLNPKPVFIEFYADWCAVCKRMERKTFQNEEVINKISNMFYAVKMNVESQDTILFGGKSFYNERSNKINSVHQIPLLLGSRKDEPFSLPAMLIFNDKFEAQARYFQFLDAKQLVEILQKAEN